MRTALRRLLPAVALTLGVAGTSLTPILVAPAHAALPKIRGVAVVDMQKVLSDTKQGQTARKKLEESSKAKQDKLDA
jgi:Skp family chaperone for outer membrane proteins